MASHPQTRRLLKAFLFFLDILGFTLVFSLVLSFRLNDFSSMHFISGPMLTFVAINYVCLYLFSLYQLDPQTPLWKKPLQCLIAVTLAGCVIVLVSYLSGAIAFTGVIGRGSLMTTQLGFGIWTAVVRFFMSKWLRGASQRLRWLVIGNEEHLLPFFQDLRTNQLTGHFAYLTPEGKPLTHNDSTSVSPASPLTIQLAGSWDDLARLERNSWTGLIVGAGQKLPDAAVETLMRFRLRGVRVYDLTDFYELIWYKVPVFYLRRSWFAMSQGFQLLHDPLGLRLKRAFDFLGALLLLLLASPILLITALAIKLESRGPIVFKQTRVGENGKLFTVYKLRSMRVDAEKNGAQWAAKNDNRVTRVGSFIRATRIDELPQLVNVLRGEMSFIGPRPERPEFTGMLEKEIPFYGLRHILRPGVTGWAQVMYPYGASIEDAREKLQFELYYIKNYSLLLDAAIVFKTIRVVLFGKGR